MHSALFNLRLFIYSAAFDYDFGVLDNNDNPLGEAYNNLL